MSKRSTLRKNKKLMKKLYPGFKFARKKKFLRLSGKQRMYYLANLFIANGMVTRAWMEEFVKKWFEN